MSKETINQRLKFLIELLNLKVGSFSRALGVSETTIRNYTDRGSKPGADFLEKLVNHFNQVNITWLVSGLGAPLSYDSSIEVAEARAAGKDDPLQQQYLAAQREIELLKSQLQDKERIIQLLEAQLKK
jgi:transcriptional regulator with XRE-family HTH domain